MQEIVMEKNYYEAPKAEVVRIDCDDVITTSILLPPHEFGRASGTKINGYDVF